MTSENMRGHVTYPEMVRDGVKLERSTECRLLAGSRLGRYRPVLATRISGKRVGSVTTFDPITAELITAVMPMTL